MAYLSVPGPGKWILNIFVENMSSIIFWSFGIPNLNVCLKKTGSWVDPQSLFKKCKNSRCPSRKGRLAAIGKFMLVGHQYVPFICARRRIVSYALRLNN